jgi:putative redox protein
MLKHASSGAMVDAPRWKAWRSAPPAARGPELTMDAAPAVGGRDSGPRPMEMLLIGLGGCTGMDVISILRKQRQVVTGYEIRVRGERAAEHPTVFTAITLEHLHAVTV